MGSSISTTTSNSNSDIPTSKVITHTGSLKEYSVPVPVSSVLGQKHTSFFLCNSQSLYFDAYIPALPLDAIVEPNQVYFMLPVSMLEDRLSGSDMAGLVSNARRVLARVMKKNRKRVVPQVDEGALVKVKINGEKRDDYMRPKMGNRGGKRLNKLGTIEEIAGADIC